MQTMIRASSLYRRPSWAGPWHPWPRSAEVGTLTIATSLCCVLASAACGASGTAPASQPARGTARAAQSVTRDAAPSDWWRDAVVYQVYVRSFQDSDGDGTGDLRGIIQRLDYLRDLGVHVVWVTPFYPSGGVDNGYDVVDFRGIDPRLGTLDDFKTLVAEMKKRDMRLVVDGVFNHSSDQHPWFKQARADPNSRYRDYYIWRPGTKGAPPNDWRSIFGGPTWTFDEASQNYYFHLFAPQQPDLNWDNPELRREIYDVMRYWRDLGVDGFRLDVISFISKRSDFPPMPAAFADKKLEYFATGPRLHEYLQEMHREVLRDHDLMTVAEAPGVVPGTAPLFVGRERKELDLLIHFDLTAVDRDPKDFWNPIGSFSVPKLKQVLLDWDRAVGDAGGSAVYLGNHDLPRMVSRFGDAGEHRIESAQLLATLLLTFRGTPFLFQGDEIGMTNTMFERMRDFRDVLIPRLRDESAARGESEAAFIERMNKTARDHARTPMQWDGTRHAGFTTGTPWLPVNANHARINVEQDRRAERSVFRHYQQLIALRRQEPALRRGRLSPIDLGSEQIIAYERTLAGRRAVIVLNFSADRVPVTLDTAGLSRALSNYGPGKDTNMLQPYEAIVFVSDPAR